MCSNSENGCGWEGELRTLDDHLTSCAYALLHFTNECMENGSEVKILCHDLEQHLKKCPNRRRQHQCPHCKATGRYCDITTTHLDACPKVKVSCPNSMCTFSIPHCDLLEHRSVCQFEVVPCKYAKIGCKEIPIRKDLQQHENDTNLHLHLAIETVNEQQKKMIVMDDYILAVQAAHVCLNFGSTNNTSPPNKNGTVLHSTLTLEGTRSV